MKMRRFFAPTMSQALKQVRREQGGAAVILSQRKVEGGVEVVSAVDPDAVEQTAELRTEKRIPPAAFQQRPAEESRTVASSPNDGAENQQEMMALRGEMQQMKAMMEQHLSLVNRVAPLRGDPKQAWLFERLSEVGIAQDVCQQIWDVVADEDPESHWRKALSWMERALPVGEDRILQQGGVIALVGPTGVGKTTMAAKLAARYALRNGTGRVALVTTDSYRIGAQEQLRAFGELIGVSVYVVNEVAELHQTLKGLSDRDLVIVDTAGLSQRDMHLLEQLALLRTGEVEIDPYLVVAANAQESALNEAVSIFNRIDLKGAILSKLDEGGALGPAMSVLLRHRLPLHYLGDGQRVPEDLQVARGGDLIDRLVSQKNIAEQHGMAAELQGQRHLHVVG